MAQAVGNAHNYTLVNEVNGANLLAQRLLEQEEYQFVSRSLTMQMPLDHAPQPTWPTGVAARRFVPGKDDQAMYNLMTETFEDDRIRSFEAWRQEFQQRADFDPSLWLLAMQGETVIGGIFSYIAPEHGWIDHLGVRHPWRRHGVGFALLQQSLATLHHKSVRTVALATNSANRTNVAQLYERAGMRIVGTIDIYEKHGEIKSVGSPLDRQGR